MENQHPAVAACVLSCVCCLTATGWLLWVLKLLILIIQVPYNLFCYTCKCTCFFFECLTCNAERAEWWLHETRDCCCIVSCEDLSKPGCEID